MVLNNNRAWSIYSIEICSCVCVETLTNRFKRNCSLHFTTSMCGTGCTTLSIQPTYVLCACKLSTIFRHSVLIPKWCCWCLLLLLLLPQPHSLTLTHMKFWLCSNYKSCFRHIAPKFEFYVPSLFQSHKWSTFIYIFLLDAQPRLLCSPSFARSIARVFVSLGHIHVAKTLNGKSYTRDSCVWVRRNLKLLKRFAEAHFRSQTQQYTGLEQFRKNWIVWLSLHWFWIRTRHSFWSFRN